MANFNSVHGKINFKANVINYAKAFGFPQNSDVLWHEKIYGHTPQASLKFFASRIRGTKVYYN